MLTWNFEVAAMELLLPSAITIFNTTPKHLINFQKPAPAPYYCSCTLTFPNSVKTQKKKHLLNRSSSSSSSLSCISSLTRTNSTSTSTATPSTFTPSLSSTASDYHHHWMVQMESPPQGVNSKPDIINYYVKTLETVIGRWVHLFLYKLFWLTHLVFLLFSGWIYVWFVVWTVRRMLRCVYMMLLAMPTLAFAATSMKKLPSSSHVCFDFVFVILINSLYIVQWVFNYRHIYCCFIFWNVLEQAQLHKFSYLKGYWIVEWPMNGYFNSTWMLM